MLAMAVSVLMVLAGTGACAISGSRGAAWITLGAAMVWPFVNRPLEGPVLLVIGHAHGLTVSDVLSPAGVLLSVLVLTGRLRGSPQGGAGSNVSRAIPPPACSAGKSD